MNSSPSSVFTLEPYVPVGNKGKGFRNINHEIILGKLVTSNFDKYLTFDLENPECDIFNVHRDIIKCCGREPKISLIGHGKLTVESSSREESNRLKSIRNLGGVNVECSPHFSWNHSKGMIFAPQPITYSETKLKEEWRDQGVIKVERLKKMISGALTPLPNLVITFKSISLPDIIKAAWY